LRWSSKLQTTPRWNYITDKEIQEAGFDNINIPASQIMTPVPAAADPRESGHDVLEKITEHNMSVIFVISIQLYTRVPVGVLRKTDLLGAKK
jgi:CBS domain-containing protein